MQDGSRGNPVNDLVDTMVDETTLSALCDLSHADSAQERAVRGKRRVLATRLSEERGLPSTFEDLADALELCGSDDERNALMREVLDVFLLAQGCIPTHGTVPGYSERV